ncbi:N-acetylmuramoyl-L-alanine amidase [Bacillus chungangensis]|uniref:N-acetylmuramoyl-L-alanine amidase n=1 Tax=Bacillus chungangensis TaxID=587633 RepID=A0ABT9WX54_9BACI|nr:N-acetylmuramoyl-L-alanine amidase [Bacillus chungangensis]MDQ0177709.1 N-acetylmuramoyl-L-alanine amidase [Bacillus chungangensis]
MNKYVKSIFLFMMAFVVMFGSLQTEANAASALKDIPEKYQKEIGYLIDRDVVSGYPDQTFRPNNNVTRAEAATLIGKAIGLNGEKRKTSFSDVKKDSFASGYIQSAFEKGIISGDGAGKFRPESNITRWEMSVLITKAFQFTKEGDAVYKDVSPSGKQYAAINKLTTAGISVGYPDGTFKPNTAITRAEFALLVARSLNEEFRILFEHDSIGERYVNATSLNVRSGPGTNHQAIGSLKHNTKVTVHEISNGWAYISAGNLKGYVHTNYLQQEEVKIEPETPVAPPKEPEKPVTPPKEPEKPVTPPKEPETPPVVQEPVERYVNVDSLNVRSGPGVNYDKIGALSYNTKVTVHETKGDWSSITAGNLKGYVNNKYLQKEEAPKQPVTPPTPAPTPPANGKRIVTIDPGHGGHDAGGAGNGLTDKEVALAVGLRVEKLLKEQGIEVIMTRSDDTFIPLSERPKIAKNSNSDVFVSIHGNSMDNNPSANGTETFYHKSNTPRAEDSKQLAGFIQKHLVSALNTRDRGLKTEPKYVTKNTTMPAVLVELAFLSNKEDAAKLAQDEYRDAAAAAITQGILDYFAWKGI